MQIHWSVLLPGVVLLCIPWTSLGPAGIRSAQAEHWVRTISLADFLAVPMNWVSLGVAGVGGYIVGHPIIWMHTFTPGRSAGKILLLQLVILTVGILAQVLRWQGKWRFFAPIFYLCGLTLGLSPWELGLFAVVVSWVFAVLARSPRIQLPLMAVALGVGAFVLDERARIVVVNSVLILGPVFMALLFQQDLMFLARNPIAKHGTVDEVSPTISDR